MFTGIVMYMGLMSLVVIFALGVQVVLTWWDES